MKAFNDAIQKRVGGRQQSKPTTAARTTKKPSNASIPKQSYDIKGKNYTSDQVKKAADASGMSVDEYIKAIGN